LLLCFPDRRFLSGAAMHNFCSHVVQPRHRLPAQELSGTRLR
jgi:hypothetical protein